MTKQVLRIGTAIMTTLLALILLWQFRTVVIYVLVSLAFAAAVRPLVQYRASRGLVYRLALSVFSLLVLIGFGLLLSWSVGSAIQDIQELAAQVSAQNEWQQPAWLQGNSFQQLLNERLPPPSVLFEAVIGEQGEFVLPAVLGFTEGIFSILSGGLIVLFLSLYWSMDQVHFERLWLSLLPPEQRKETRSIWRSIELAIGAYIRNELLQSFLAGLLLGLGYWFIGSPYPVLLALIGALAWLIPVVGVILAVVAPLVLGLLTGVSVSLLSALYTLTILIILQGWVEPRLTNHRQHNPILTLVILMALADAYGILGIIVAPPVSIACQILWDHLINHRAEAVTQIVTLKERQLQVWHTIRAMESPPPLAVSSIERLTRLLENAAPLLNAAAVSDDLSVVSVKSPTPFPNS